MEVLQTSALPLGDGADRKRILRGREHRIVPDAPRPIKAPQVRSVVKGSRAKYANLLRVTHRDEVEAPITDWLREAYDMHDALRAKG